MIGDFRERETRGRLGIAKSFARSSLRTSTRAMDGCSQKVLSSARSSLRTTTPAMDGCFEKIFSSARSSLRTSTGAMESVFFFCFRLSSLWSIPPTSTHQVKSTAVGFLLTELLFKMLSSFSFCCGRLVLQFFQRHFWLVGVLGDVYRIKKQRTL